MKPRNFLSFFFALLSINAQAQKINPKALQELVQLCKNTHSTGLSIWLNGKPYRDYVFDSADNKAATYSAQKSLISLAIGRLMMDGSLASIDSPVYNYFPEWKQGLKNQ
jgi:CubicO group peptidase (beta-lactamase class C family)